MGRPSFNFDDPADIVAFKDILESLSPKDQDVCRLQMQGYTQEEIGVELGMWQRTVGRHLARLQKNFGRDA